MVSEKKTAIYNPPHEKEICILDSENIDMVLELNREVCGYYTREDYLPVSPLQLKFVESCLTGAFGSWELQYERFL